MISFQITQGNTDDRKSVPTLVKGFSGKGSISKKLTETLALDDMTLMTTLKKNMKPRLLEAVDKI